MPGLMKFTTYTSGSGSTTGNPLCVVVFRSSITRPTFNYKKHLTKIPKAMVKHD
jgi:hypothetical protein